MESEWRLERSESQNRNEPKKNRKPTATEKCDLARYEESELLADDDEIIRKHFKRINPSSESST